MVIMIVFLALSVVFIIGTVIYLNHKKKSNVSSIKQHPKEEQNVKTNKETKKQRSEERRVGKECS